MEINNVNTDNQGYYKTNSAKTNDEDTASIFESLNNNRATDIDENDLSGQTIKNSDSALDEILREAPFMDVPRPPMDPNIISISELDSPKPPDADESGGYKPEQSQNGEYTYKIKDAKQVTNMLKDAQKYLNNLPKECADTYKKLIGNIHYNKDGSMDIEHTDTLKAFLALKKIIKYEGKIPIKEKRIDETTPLLGDYWSEYKNYSEYINKNSAFKNALIEMHESIYMDINARHIIPNEQADKADIVAERIFQEEMKKYNIDNPSNLYGHNNIFPGVTYTVDSDTERTDWNMQIVVQEERYGNETNYTPTAAVLLQELYHVKQTKPGARRNDRDKFPEIGATINQMMIEDKIYKEVNNIDINQEVNYPNSNFELPNGKSLNYGKIANTLRQIMQENNFKTVEEAVMSPKGQEFIMKNFGS